MATRVEYIIVDITGVSELSPKKKSDSKSKIDAGTQNLKTLSKSEEYTSAGDSAALSKAFNYFIENTEKTLSTAWSMGWNRYTTLQEDYLAENKINNIKTSVNNIKSISSSTLQGITTGATTGFAMGGPVGAAIGAVAGAASGLSFWGVNQHLKNQKELSNYYRQLNQTNFQTYLDSSRAGLVNNGRGTEN